VLLFCVKNGKHQDVEEFLGFYLDALDEELAELHNDISTHTEASDSRVEPEGLEEEVQSGSSRIEVGKRDNSVRQFFFLSFH
jgi:hypothetical protein